jgi:hypothetical protein
MSKGNAFVTEQKVRIDVNMAASDKVTWAITSGARWSIEAGTRSDGFSIRAAAGGASPAVLSVNQLSLSASQLSITAGPAALTATIIAHMEVDGCGVSGTTNCSDPAMTATASYGDDITTEFSEDWTLSFDG